MGYFLVNTATLGLLLFVLNSDALNQTKFCVRNPGNTLCVYPSDEPDKFCADYKSYELTKSDKREVVLWHREVLSRPENDSNGESWKPFRGKIRWDRKLSAIAERWARRCNLQEDPNRNFQNHVVEQNIFFVKSQKENDLFGLSDLLWKCRNSSLNEEAGENEEKCIESNKEWREMSRLWKAFKLGCASAVFKESNSTEPVESARYYYEFVCNYMPMKDSEKHRRYVRQIFNLDEKTSTEGTKKLPKTKATTARKFELTTSFTKKLLKTTPKREKLETDEDNLQFEDEKLSKKLGLKVKPPKEEEVREKKVKQELKEKKEKEEFKVKEEVKERKEEVKKEKEELKEKPEKIVAKEKKEKEREKFIKEINEAFAPKPSKGKKEKQKGKQKATKPKEEIEDDYDENYDPDEYNGSDDDDVESYAPIMSIKDLEREIEKQIDKDLGPFQGFMVTTEEGNDTDYGAVPEFRIRKIYREFEEAHAAVTSKGKYLLWTLRDYAAGCCLKPHLVIIIFTWLIHILCTIT